MAENPTSYEGAKAATHCHRGIRLETAPTWVQAAGNKLAAPGPRVIMSSAIPHTSNWSQPPSLLPAEPPVPP